MWIELEYDPDQPEFLVENQDTWHIAVDIESTNSLIVKKIDEGFSLQLHNITAGHLAAGEIKERTLTLNTYSSYRMAVRAAEGILNSLRDGEIVHSINHR